MSTELIIAGEMGKGGGSTEYKDTLISEQTVKTLFAVGEGVIDSVENVYLDTVEIANFDATLVYRVGTSSQTVIDGFTVTESPLPGFTAKNIIRDSTKPNGQELPNVSTGITVTATSLVTNTWYRITSLGTTNFKSCGASKNAVGIVFKATSVGTGTGITVQMQPNFQVPETIVSIPYEEAMKSVRCSFTFSALSKTDGDGNIVGSTVVFEVYVRNNTTTGLWTLLNNKQYTVKGKTTHGYTFDLEINRPTTATTTWQVKVIRITPDSGTVKKQDTMQWSAVTQLYHSDLTYSGTALAAVTLRDATQFGNRIPEIMFKVKGKKIRLPTNYTPSTSTTVGTYNGNWDGTLHTTYLQYSNNPAWCLYDVLTDVNSGLGIPEADLDKYSFYNLGKYCDDALPNGYSEVVVCRDNGELLEEPYPLYIPRHTLDYSFNTRENVKDFLSQILSLCNANLITNEFGQVAVIFQQRGQIVKRNVTNANVIEGTFTYQSSNIEQRTNLVNVTYNRGLNFGRTDTATVSDDSLIARYGLRPTDVVLPGCYYEAQAIRKARWVLYTNCYFTDFVTFSVFLDGMTYKIGDLIRVYDNYNQTNTQSGLLTSAVISGSSTTLTFDREISLPAGTYTFHSYDSSGNEVTKVISGGLTINNIVISSALSINIGVVFVIAGTSEGKIYRATSISRSEENIYSVTALEFDEAIFDYVDSGLNLTQKTGDFANVGQFSTVPVESISVKENFGTNGTYTNGRLQVSWVWDSAKTQKYRANFKVTWLLDDGIPTIIDTITSDTYDIMNPVPGVYTISVWAVNSFTGIYSQVLTTTYNFRTVTTSSTLQPPINVRIAGTIPAAVQPTTLEFSTPELTLAFDYNPANQSVADAIYDYLVEIWDSAGVNKMESYSINPAIGVDTVDPIDEYLLYKPINGAFALPFNRNVNIFGGTPARTFKVKIYSRDTLGDISLPIEVTVINPVPALTSMTITPGVANVVASIDASSELDVKDYLIYRGTTSGFTANDTSLIYKGASNRVILPTPDSSTYYYKYSISDSFGSTGLYVSNFVSSNSISADIINRYSYVGLQFTPNENVSPNTIAWTQFTAYKDDGTSVVVNAGSAEWTSDVLYLYYDGTSTLKYTTSSTTAVSGRILATYAGGNNVTTDAGKAFIDGDQIIAGSLLANALSTSTAYITNMAMIGNIIQSDNYSANSGWRIDKNGSAKFTGLTVQSSTIDSNSTIGSSSVTNLLTDVATGVSRNKTFYASSAPTASSAGDLWYDTGTGTLKRWSGSTWDAASDTTLSKLGGSGVNVMHPRYCTFEEANLPPIVVSTGTGAGTWSLDSTTSAIGSKSLKLSKSVTSFNDYCALAPAPWLTYNQQLQPNKKWIFSIFMKSSVANFPVNMFVRYAGDTNAAAFTLTTGLANTWARYSYVLDFSTLNVKDFVIIIDPLEFAVADLWFDGLMIEEQIGTLTTPSAYAESPNFLTTYTGDLDAIKNANSSGAGTPSISGRVNDTYFDTTTNLMWVYRSTGWQKVMPLVTSSNISNFIDNASIGSAQIGNAQVGTLKIGANQVTINEVFTIASTTLTLPIKANGELSANTILSSMSVVGTDTSITRCVLVMLTLVHYQATDGWFSLTLGTGTEFEQDINTRITAGTSVAQYPFLFNVTTTGTTDATVDLGSLVLRLKNGSSSSSWWGTTAPYIRASIVVMTGKR